MTTDAGTTSPRATGGSVAARPLDPKVLAGLPGGASMKTRCEECGWRSSPNERWCPKHPEATMIPWPKRMDYAMGYVVRRAALGYDAEAMNLWVNVTAIMRHYTGCRRIDLQDALRYARKWQLPEFREGQAKPVTPKGLYG